MDTLPQQFDVLHLLYLGNPSSPSCVGSLHLEDDGDGVSLHYSPAWLSSGFPLSEEPVLADTQQMSEVALRVEAAVPLGVLEAKMVAGGGSPMGGAKPVNAGRIFPHLWEFWAVSPALKTGTPF